MGSFGATTSYFKTALDAMLCTWFPGYSDLKVPHVDMTGKTAIITGANTGIGLETARKLAQFGAKVILAVRDPAKGDVARRDIVDSTGNDNVEVRVVDFANQESVRRLVEQLKGDEFDLLINNAGLNASHYTLTDEGVESSYAVNFLHPLLFTHLLLPSLTPTARIINVSSVASYTIKSISTTDLDSCLSLTTKGVKDGDVLASQTAVELYGIAKLSQIVWTRELQKRLLQSEQYKSITVHSCHPGLVKSSIYGRNAGTSEEYDKFFSKLSKMIDAVGISVEQGASTSVFLAADPLPATKGGLYWTRHKVYTPNAIVEKTALRAELWNAWIAKSGAPDM
ncbi:hypothetical protein MNV49_005338 [Pseudohyphozyma bogoriensis]|nr:hypothetical protein MNV49_005338 [Pseudohyphozyma bogoriensis]